MFVNVHTVCALVYKEKNHVRIMRRLRWSLLCVVNSELSSRWALCRSCNYTGREKKKRGGYDGRTDMAKEGDKERRTMERKDKKSYIRTKRQKRNKNKRRIKRIKE